MMISYAVYGAIAAVLLVFVGIYNSLVTRRNQVENVAGSIDAYLKKRYDLIPKLVDTAKVFMEHERGTLEGVVSLRNSGLAPGAGLDQRLEADREITRILSGLRVSFEQYPQLKSDSHFLQLQSALSEVEEQLSAARRAYNAAVTDYNNGVEMIPHLFVARLAGMSRKETLRTPEAELRDPNVRELFRR